MDGPPGDPQSNGRTAAELAFGLNNNLHLNPKPKPPAAREKTAATTAAKTAAMRPSTAPTPSPVGAGKRAFASGQQSFFSPPDAAVARVSGQKLARGPPPPLFEVPRYSELEADDSESDTSSLNSSWGSNSRARWTMKPIAPAEAGVPSPLQRAFWHRNGPGGMLHSPAPSPSLPCSCSGGEESMCDAILCHLMPRSTERSAGRRRHRTLSSQARADRKGATSPYNLAPVGLPALAPELARSASEPIRDLTNQPPALAREASDGGSGGRKSRARRLSARGQIRQALFVRNNPNCSLRSVDSGLGEPSPSPQHAGTFDLTKELDSWTRQDVFLDDEGCCRQTPPLASCTPNPPAEDCGEAAPMREEGDDGEEPSSQATVLAEEEEDECLELDASQYGAPPQPQQLARATDQEGRSAFRRCHTVGSRLIRQASADAGNTAAVAASDLSNRLSLKTRIMSVATMDVSQDVKMPLGLLPPGLDVRGDCLAKCGLPTTMQEHSFHKELRCISPTTLVGLMAGRFADKFSNFIVVDARFPYEWEGGHIVDSHNLWTMEMTVSAFFDQPVVDITNGERTAIIFHCEFSSHRAPTQFKHIRDLDKTITLGLPNLAYPELYILEGGYKRFFEEYPSYCTPGVYRTMKDKDFTRDCVQNENILSCSREAAQRKKWEQHSVILELADRVKAVGLDDALEFVAQRNQIQAGEPATPRTPMA